MGSVRTPCVNLWIGGNASHVKSGQDFKVYSAFQYKSALDVGKINALSTRELRRRV